MRSLFLGIVLLSIAGMSPAQTLEADLNGFRLGQFREVPRNVLGDPFQVIRHEDGFISEVFLLKPDTSLYMVFEYAPKDSSVIWSIQLTGSTEGYSCGMKGLKLGMDPDRVEKLLGQPNHIKDMGEYGEKWEYDKTNYSVEIDRGSRLSSVKILTKGLEPFPNADVPVMPGFDIWTKVLLEGNRKQVSELLAPDLEIYDGEQALFFRWDWWLEIEMDRSGLYARIEKLKAIIRQIEPKSRKTYEEYIRLDFGPDVQHVCKFTLDGQVTEVVFRSHNGPFRIWEIRFGE